MSRTKSMFLALALLVPAPASAADFLGKSAAEWARDLESEKPEVRRRAVFALGKADAETYVLKLTGLLRNDPDVGVRDAAAVAVGDIVTASKGAAVAYWNAASPALRAALTDVSPRVKRSAAYAIGAFGREAKDAIPDLRIALNDSAPTVRQNAAWALGRIGKEAGEDVVDLLCARLRDENPLVRRDAVTALGGIGLPTAGRAWKDLLDLVRSESIRPEPDDVLLRTALAQLTVLLDSKNQQVIDAMMVLVHGHNSAEIHEKLDPAINGVLRNLGGIGLPDARAAREAALARYHQALQGGDVDPVVDALNLLGEVGRRENEKAKASLEPLFRLVANEDVDTRQAAAFALARIGGPMARLALPVLKEALNDPDSKVQEQAATFLGEMGPEAGDAAAALADALRPSHAARVRVRAAETLTKIGDAAAKVTPQLLEALRTDDTTETRKYDLRKYVAEVFAQMGYPNNQAALPALVDFIAQDSNRQVRHRCIWAFLNIDKEIFPTIRGKSGSAEKVLTNVLSDPSLDNFVVVRYDAARALAFNLGAKAPDKAVDVLLHMLNNDNLYIYQGTEAKVTDVGREGTSGTTQSGERKGGDGRFMAANALAMMGAKVAKDDRVLAALRKAKTDTTDKTGRLQKEAAKALEELKK